MYIILNAVQYYCQCNEVEEWAWVEEYYLHKLSLFYAQVINSIGEPGTYMPA